MIDFFKCGDASKLSHLATVCFMKLSISIIHGDHKSKKWNVVNVVRIYFKTYWLYLEKKILLLFSWRTILVLTDYCSLMLYHLAKILCKLQVTAAHIKIQCKIFSITSLYKNSEISQARNSSTPQFIHFSNIEIIHLVWTTVPAVIGKSLTCAHAGW